MTGRQALKPSWDRPRWARFADDLLLAVRPYASPGKARFQLPGPRSGLGYDVDGLEAFTRTLLMAGFRLAGERGADPLGLAEWYAEGIAAGTDPTSPERWPRLDEHPQAKVEAASLALVLDLTRPWLWDRLESRVQRQVVDYLSPAVGDETYPQINWVWFRLVVQTFLRSVGGPHALAEMRADLATHDTFVRGDGWLSDGDTRAYDHYVGWALHLYPTLWARMQGADDLSAGRRERDRALLDRYLVDAVRLVGADGSPLMQGRSLIYRFAAAAPYWVGALAEVPSVPLGQLRRAASLIAEHFTHHGVPDERGLLTMGWHGEWDRLAQSYSGSGSPYWAAKGLLGLALPADHPAWTAPEVALPAESRDEVFAIPAPGWLVSSTVADGVVRITNHGTDHARVGDEVGDSPIYAKLAYSTATMPLLHLDGWTSPLDNSVVLLDADGRATHRAGMELLAIEVDGATGVGLAASVARPHWLAADTDGFNHGYGLVGEATDAGELLVVSLVRGPWEVRLARPLAPATDAVSLRIGGWPVAACTDRGVEGREARATDGRLTSRIVASSRGENAALDVDLRDDASPLGAPVATPTATFPVVDGAWVAALVELSGTPAEGDAFAVAVDTTPAGATFRVTWPDGVATTTPMDHPSAADRRREEETAGPPSGPDVHEGETR